MPNRLIIAAGACIFSVFLAGQAGRASAAYYDLEVTRIYAEPATPGHNVECDLNVEIRSNSDVTLADNTGFSSYDYSFSNFQIISRTLPALAQTPLGPGGTVRYVFRGSFTSKGINNVSFIVDEANDLGETEMGNNTWRGTIEVVPPDEVSIYDISLWPASPVVDQPVLVTVTILNSGYRDLISSVGIGSYAYIFPNFVKTKLTAPSISIANKFLVNSTMSFLIEGYFTSPGEKSLNFIVDTDNQLDETNKTNNQLAKTFTIAASDSADLAVESITVESATAQLLKSTDATIVVRIKNQGAYSLTSGNGFLPGDCMFKFDGFETVSRSQGAYPTFAAPLEPGGAFEYRLAGRFYQSGPLTLYAAINTVGRITEADEKNNTLSQEVYVYASQTEADSFELNAPVVWPVSSTTAEIRWTTSKEADGEVYYRRSIYNLFNRFDIVPRLEAWPATTNVKDHAVRLVSLRPGDTYVYQVAARRNDVEKKSAEYSFVQPADDNVKLLGDITAAVDAAEGKAAIEWQTNLAADGLVWHKMAGQTEYTRSGSDEFNLNHTVALNNLAEGEYVYYIESKSQTGTFYRSGEKSFSVNKTIVSPPLKMEEVTPVSREAAVVVPAASSKTITNRALFERLKGRILLQVEAHGEAHYVNPQNSTAYYLGRPEDAFSVMRSQGVGITDANLKRIPVGLSQAGGKDADGDGLSDGLEDGLGTDKNKRDTDGDGHSDDTEIISGYDPNGPGRLPVSVTFTQGQAGRIFLQVEKNGEAWYINPADNKRYFLGRPADAFAIMRNLGLGISDKDFASL